MLQPEGQELQDERECCTMSEDEWAEMMYYEGLAG